MDLIQDLDDLLSQMEDVKFKKVPPPPPPKPSSSSSANGGMSSGTPPFLPIPIPPQTATGEKTSQYLTALRQLEAKGKPKPLKHKHGANCPHMEEYPVFARAETHPIMPNPHPLNLDEHMTSNTLFPTPAPPKPIMNPRPGQTSAKEREVLANFKSPFNSETYSDKMKKFGIDNADDEEQLKFNSYHLDYKYTPPPIKGPCVVCGEGIIGPLVTAMDQMWHPEHFCCANCDRELRPPYFLEHDGEPYCKACHQKLFLPPCAACGQYIPDKYISALGKVWHPECFVCTKCGVMLPEKGFKQNDGKPYCEKDYHDLFSPKCHGCQKPITDGRKVDALGREWHPGCFKCTKCGIVLNPNKFFEKNGLPYCEHDFNDLFLPKCAGCNTPIKQNPLKVLGKPWHPQCFKCTDCKKQLSPNKFFEKNDQPFCEDCFHNRYSAKCCACNTPIKENPVHAMGKTWHQHCFRCAVCNKKLSPNNYFEKDGIPYCEDDWHNKFSPKCAGCPQPIKDGNATYAMGKTWHPNCFNCNVCRKKLSPSNFMERDGKSFCEDCYHDKFSPKCHQCHGPIKGEPTRAMGTTWHTECFKCTECQSRLNPTNFMEKNGSPYCNHCFHEKFSPKCNHCRGPITENPTRAMGKMWHSECFKCTECSSRLAPNNFMEKNGSAYCTNCYHRLFSPQCFGCKKPITDGKPLVAMGKTWHPEHFCCSDCNRNLTPTNYFEREGRIYCEDDYHRRFSPKCSSCSGPIKDNRAVVAMGRNWHPECFRCAACNKQLAENAYYEHNGKAYCVDDWMNMFAPRCKGCKQPIKDAYCLYALNGDWHPHCFRCRDCNIQLEDKNFFEFEGEPYCEKHYHDRICPDCLKMRRAVERYCGKTTVTTKIVGAQQAYKTINIPGRPGAKSETLQHRVTFQDLETKTTEHSSSTNVNVPPPAVKINDERPISSQSQYSMESAYKDNRSGNYSGSEYSALRTPSPMPPAWSTSLAATGSDAQTQREEKFETGKFPVGNQMYEFERKFKKEEFQSVSRY